MGDGLQEIVKLLRKQRPPQQAVFTTLVFLNMMKILSALLITSSLNRTALFITNAASDHKYTKQKHAPLISWLCTHCQTPSSANETPRIFMWNLGDHKNLKISRDSKCKKQSAWRDWSTESQNWLFFQESPNFPPSFHFPNCRLLKVEWGHWRSFSPTYPFYS